MINRRLLTDVRRCAGVALFGTFFIGAAASHVFAQGPGGPNGADILIRAENRSTSDTPFCGIGGGMVGDRLDVDAFMDMNGVVTGTARFEDANGAVTVIDLNRMFGFSICSPANCGGILIQNAQNQNTVPIWMNSIFANLNPPLSPALVNVELPRGCSNTKSTFTPGVDKVTMQIKFR